MTPFSSVWHPPFTPRSLTSLPPKGQALTSPSLSRSVEIGLKQLDLGDQDKAAAVLARRYAEQIDGHRDDPKLHAWALRWIGPLLLQTLQQLGMTPAARAQTMKGPKPSDDNGPRAALYELRARPVGADRLS